MEALESLQFHQVPKRCDGDADGPETTFRVTGPYCCDSQTLASIRSPGESLKMQIAGPHLQSLWLSRCGMELENLHFTKLPGDAAAGLGTAL